MVLFMECHLINTLRSGVSRTTDYEEIAAPAKLVEVVDSLKPLNEWRILQRGNDIFYTASFSSFHIVTQHPSIFCANPEFNEEWLLNKWNVLFLVTTRYFDTHDTLDALLDHHCYTVCNGFTLFLALHRFGRLRVKHIYDGLRRFVATHGSQPFQVVQTSWEALYYGLPINNIADIPWYYACTGPAWADVKIVNLFRENAHGQLDPYAQIIRNDNVVYYTSCFSAMIPYFNRQHWESHLVHSQWPHPNHDEQVFRPNINDFLLAVCRTKRSFKWFEPRCQHYITTICACFEHDTKGMLMILSVLCNLYDARYRCRRLRQIWRLLISECSYKSILENVLVYTFSDYFLPNVPIGFFVDSLPHANLYLNNLVRLFSHASAPLLSSHRLFYKKYLEKRIHQRLMVINRFPHPINTLINTFIKEKSRTTLTS